MRPKNIITAILFTIFFYSNSFAQSFVDIYPFPQIGDKVRVIKKDGTEVKGVFKYWNGTMKNTINFAIKPEEGKNIKFNPEDVDRIYLTLSSYAKFVMNVEGKEYQTEDKNLANIYVNSTKVDENTKFHKVGNNVVTSQQVKAAKEATQVVTKTISEFISVWKKRNEQQSELIFEFIQEKPGKYAMREMINPGFESKYKAFLFGYNYNKIVLIDNSGNQKMITKENFKEDFKNAFSDCEQFIQNYNDLTNINFEKLAFYLFTYSYMCD